MKARKIGTTSTTEIRLAISLPDGVGDAISVRRSDDSTALGSDRRWSGTEHLPPALDHAGDEPGSDPESSCSREILSHGRKDSGYPAFLVSTIIHTLLLIVLGLLTLPARSGKRSFLEARLGEASETVLLQQIDVATVLSDQSSDDAADDTVTFEVNSQPVAIASPSVAKADDAGESLPLDDAWTTLLGGGTSESKLVQIATGGGLAGRKPDQRKTLALAGGGSVASENAVDMALEYLANHQRPNGSWSFDLSLDPCGGKCRHSKKIGNDPTPPTAATGLALLTFLGAGHTHTGNGPYANHVRRGLYYLRGVVAESQLGLDWQQGSMYGHAIALMAMNEATTMTTNGDPKDHEFYNLLYRTTSFTCNAQHHSGSWGYYPQSPGDTTLTGWQVLSLIAAKRNRIPLQTVTLQRAKQFVLSTRPDEEYSFGYKGPPGEPTTTAVGLTLMLYLGESPYDYRMIQALADMADRGPKLTNIYHDYYATLALHHTKNTHYGKEIWEQWNQTLRDHLVSSQETSGHEKGSWHFDNRWGNVGGRLYTTAMCALTLQAYYRYEPLYGPADSFQLD
jgi:hypothetical protein